MRIKIYLLGVILLTVFLGCEKDDEKELMVKPEAQGTFVDERDGQEYDWVRYAGLDWMVQNMVYGYGIDAEPYYDLHDTDDKQIEDVLRNMEEYGLLYTYDKAMAAAPKGWRVATDEDWKQLEKALGMNDRELDLEGFRGSVQGELMQQDSVGTGLSMQLGGYFGHWGNYNNANYFGVYGFFWVASEEDAEVAEGNAIYRKISYNSSRIYRGTTLKKKRMSVRCVRDATKE